MNFDQILDAFAFAEEIPDAAIAAAPDGWEQHGPSCRALLQGYVAGEDLSERTERAMLVTIHLLGERKDTASFPTLCALAGDPERLGSAFGEDGIALSYPAMLVSTFAGDPAPLHGLIESPAADELARGDALLVLAYLVRTDRMPERDAYEYLAALPARLAADPGHYVWFGYARAVAALGFIGLAAAVEALMARGLVGADLLNSEEFWSDLRACQQDPRDFTHPIWAYCEPAGSAVDRLLMLANADDADGAGPEDAPEPIRNPLRNVGRNDPCPCGSGKKFKKCCLAAGAV